MGEGSRSEVDCGIARCEAVRPRPDSSFQRNAARRQRRKRMKIALAVVVKPAAKRSHGHPEIREMAANADTAPERIIERVLQWGSPPHVQLQRGGWNVGR